MCSDACCSTNPANGNNTRLRDMDTLEAMIDRRGLRKVIGDIAAICQDKAEHIRTNWQDGPTADVWDSAANRLESVRDKVIY